MPLSLQREVRCLQALMNLLRRRSTIFCLCDMCDFSASRKSNQMYLLQEQCLSREDCIHMSAARAHVSCRYMQAKSGTQSYNLEQRDMP